MSKAPKTLNWKEMPRGGMIPEAGNAEHYHTGSWRTYRPIWSDDRCIQCYNCWIFCPDSAIVIKDGKVAGMDLDYCKGCGICARECPPKANAIEMKLESDLEEE